MTHLSANCFHFDLLYELVIKKYQPVKDKLRELAIKMGDKTSRKSAGGQNIFVSKEIYVNLTSMDSLNLILRIFNLRLKQRL